MRRNSPTLFWLAALATLPTAHDHVVAPTGGDFTTIQAALDVAVAGDRVLVREKPGGYGERIVFPRDGTPQDGYIELCSYPGESPALDGTGIPGLWMVTLQDRSYIRIEGLEIRNNLGVSNDGSGIRVQGAGSHVEIKNNTIHDMRGFGAMAITVYGTSVAASISHLTIDGNVIYDCEPSDSEALTLNGNVELFRVTNNVVRDVNNIGIDFIGGETDINPTFVARNGLCRGNIVLRANSNQGGGYAGGIYVDGGKDIVIERNLVAGSDLGIEVGAENQGTLTTGIVVRNNLIVANEKVGLIFGGFDASAGRVSDCFFYNNVCHKNDTLGTDNGEILVQFADDCVIVNNVFYAGPQKILLASYSPNTGNRFDYNQWYTEGAANQARFLWDDEEYFGFAAYRAGTGHDPGSDFGDPLFEDPDGPDDVLGSADDDFRLLQGSPCTDAGDNGPINAKQLDYAGRPRRSDDPTHGDTGLGLRPVVDRGAHERGVRGTQWGASPVPRTR